MCYLLQIGVQYYSLCNNTLISVDKDDPSFTDNAKGSLTMAVAAEKGETTQREEHCAVNSETNST